MATGRAGTFKFYLLCILVGLLTGLVAIPFRYLLVKSVVVRDFLYGAHASWWLHVGVVVLMWAVAMLIHRLVVMYPLISGSGIPQVEGMINGRFRFGHSLRMLAAKFVGGVLGIGMGFSLGREGPSVQMGTFVARWVARWAGVGTVFRKYLVMGGASAGLSSAFTAPLASAIFMVEEVERFDSKKIAISSLLAAIAGGWMARLVFPDQGFSAFDVVEPSGLGLWRWVVIFVLFSCLLSLEGKVFNVLLLRFQAGYRRMKQPVWLRVLGVVVATYILGCTLPDLLSGGEGFLIVEAGDGSTGLLLLSGVIVIELFFTPLCYATGFPGGIFLPLLVIGGLTGKWFGLCLSFAGVIGPEHYGYFMLIGMSALFAAVVRSPITGLVLILEMTGKFTIFFPMIVVVGLTFFVSAQLGVTPIYESLYRRLLPRDWERSRRRYVIPFEVCPDSYLEGRNVSGLCLPENCVLTRTIRDGRALPSGDLVLRVGDRVEIELESRDLEKLYRSFRSLANE